MATWPNSKATQGKFTKQCSGYKGSVGSPCYASTLQVTDRETDPSSHRRRRTLHHHLHSLHNLAKLIARDKAVSTFELYSQTIKRGGNNMHFGCSKEKGSNLVYPI
jgi:hypothetical protein